MGNTFSPLVFFALGLTAFRLEAAPIAVPSAPISTDSADLKTCGLEQNRPAVERLVRKFFVERGKMSPQQLHDYDYFSDVKAALNGCYAFKAGEALRFDLVRLQAEWADDLHYPSVDPVVITRGGAPTAATLRPLVSCVVAIDRKAAASYLGDQHATGLNRLSHVSFLIRGRFSRCFGSVDKIAFIPREQFDRALGEELAIK